MTTYRARSTDPLTPLTDEEKSAAFEALHRAQELREELERRGYRWKPVSEELDELREKRENEIG